MEKLSNVEALADYHNGQKVEKTESSHKIPHAFTVRNETLYYVTPATEKKDSEEIYISRHVPYITKEFSNIERNQKLYEVNWKDRNRNHSEVVLASTISDATKLIELSDNGFSVNTGNRSHLIKYIDLFLLINDIERHSAVERIGQIKNEFIHPLMTENIEILAMDDGKKQFKEAFEVNGTSTSWNEEVFERIKDQPKAVFMMLSSFASVIIQDLRIKPFIVDLSGHSSRGKTTSLEVASTVWGNKSLISEWNATRVSIERKAAYLNSFPFLIDDTRKANERILKDIVYQFSGGRSKGRGSPTGSQQEYTWNNIMLSTGEVSLNEYTENAAGAAARVIPLTGDPLKDDYIGLTELQTAMENNYGAIGIEFLELWLDKKEELIKEFHKVKMFYTEKSKGNNILGRLAEFYASVHFAGVILKDYLNVDVNLSDLIQLFNEIAEDNRAVDKPMEFLERILIDLDSKRDSIYYDYPPRGVDTRAIYKKEINQLLLTPSYTKEFLGIEERQTRNEWLNRGITIANESNGKKNDYKLISHKGEKFRGISLNMEIVEQLGFDFYKDEK